MSLITLFSLSKQFPNTRAVQDIHLEIRSGEFFSILGPSGCGKTTLLRMIAGFEQPSAGDIFINGDRVTGRSPKERGVGMVFQNYALFPHMTVFENVAFGLETQGLAKSDIRTRVAKILTALHLDGKIHVSVQQLSGGEQQRVAVARALVVEPTVLLMDEPLSNLDIALRLKMREEIRTLQRSIGITTIYVTHDQSEAMSLSDRIAVMREGRLEQIGTPPEMYEHPATPFVAEFLGGANVLKGILNLEENTIHVGALRVAVPPALLAGRANGMTAVVAKPEAIVLSSPVQKGEYEARILHREYLGFTTNFVVESHGRTLRSSSISSVLTKQLRAGDTVGVSFDWSRCVLLASTEME